MPTSNIIVDELPDKCSSRSFSNGPAKQPEFIELYGSMIRESVSSFETYKYFVLATQRPKLCAIGDPPDFSVVPT